MRRYGLLALAASIGAIVVWLLLLSGVYGLLIGLMAVRCALALAFRESDCDDQLGQRRAGPAMRLTLVRTAPETVGRCLVCATGIEKGQVLRTCPSCDTALHGECYEYLGGCARFGCAARAVASSIYPRRA